MVGPSKILTVSYGTFSCTLEGFDDPFSTMRGISEYFRDLAAEDRYFGAEPPTPDAEMLHRIAEREVKRRVEAQVENGGITLRQLEPSEAEITEPVPNAVSPALAAVKAAAEIEIVEEPAKTAPPAPVAQESVAAKLARIRAVVSDETDDEYSDESFSTASISSAFDDVIDAPVVEEVEADAPKEPEVDIAVETVEEEIDADETPVAETFEPEAAQDAETETASAVETNEPEIVEEGIKFAEPEIILDNAPEHEDDVETASSDDDAVSRLMAAVSTSDTEEDGVDEQDIPETDETPDQATIARVIKMRRSDFEAAVSEGNLEEIDEGDTIDLEAVQTAIETPNEPESSLSAEDEAELMSTLEQVQREADAERRSEKEGRAMLENADVEADTSSVARILEVTNSEMEETEGTRRRSAIAHLKAAVAATRADKFLKKKQEENDTNELNQYRDDLARVVRPKRPPEVTKAERRMAPLMLVSEQRIDESDETVSGTAAVVRPRRVRSVEDEEAAANGSEDNIFRDAGSFAEFAEEMGASELPDLLEAAAAYYAFIEGRDHFSRPQIMKVVASVDEDNPFSREDGLRSFGMLLRRGKIQKVKRGQFKVASSTRFNPEARAAGE